MDPKRSPQERAELLVRELSLDEKMAQLNCIFPFEQYAQDYDWIKTQTPHGIGQVSTLEVRRMESLQEAAAWQRHVQKIIMENSPHHIPAIFHMEGLCGAFIQDSTSFPSGIARSRMGSGTGREIARTVSRQEAACGITHIFAPVLDITRDGRMGRQGESYGEDPLLASALGSAYVRGIQKQKPPAGHRRARPSTSLPFIIHRAASTAPTAIHRPAYCRRSTEDRFRPRYRQA